MTKPKQKHTPGPGNRSFDAGFKAGSQTAYTKAVEKIKPIYEANKRMADVVGRLIALADRGIYIDLQDVEATPISRELRSALALFPKEAKP